VKPKDPLHSVSYGHYAVVSYSSVSVLNFFHTDCITVSSKFHVLVPHVKCEIKENFLKVCILIS